MPTRRLASTVATVILIASYLGNNLTEMVGFLERHQVAVPVQLLQRAAGLRKRCRYQRHARAAWSDARILSYWRWSVFSGATSL